MGKHPNLYRVLFTGSGCNALQHDRIYGVKFLNEFQDRLFFGTDICALDISMPLVDSLMELRGNGDILEDVFQKVARRNVIRVLGK